MKKSRRLADIRTRASEQNEILRARSALRRRWGAPVHGWHEAFLDAFARGSTITAAAQAAGVSRNAVYWARQNAPGFEHAFRLMLAVRGSTMKRNGSTKFRMNGDGTLPSGARQIANARAALANEWANARNLFPLVENSAIFPGSNPLHREAARP